MPESSSGLSPSGAANYLGSVLIAEAPPNLASGLVAGVLLWRVIGWLSAPGDWAPGVGGWEAGIRPGERWGGDLVGAGKTADSAARAGQPAQGTGSREEERGARDLSSFPGLRHICTRFLFSSDPERCQRCFSFPPDCKPCPAARARSLRGGCLPSPTPLDHRAGITGCGRRRVGKKTRGEGSLPSPGSRGLLAARGPALTVGDPARRREAVRFFCPSCTV